MSALLENAKLIFEGNNSIVYQTKLNGEEPKVLKILKEQYATPEQLALFHNEYDIIENLEIEGIRKVYEKINVEGKAALMLEYIEGTTLKQAVREKEFSLGEFLDISMRLCEILGNIHQHNIIHKDINSNNILITQKERRIKIIDFGISSKISLKTQHLGNPEKLQGTLAYISPEQTGRMNRIVDYRTDLYSLGVVLYEIITQTLPFQSEDALELVHAHLAKPPQPPHKRKEEIPEAVSEIILKLLAKNAEDRYQSAFGVKADLAKVKEQLQKYGIQKISKFPLGKDDFSGKFQIPQKLYGREQEIHKILTTYEKACWGSKELLLVSGYSGVGKSAIIHEIHKPVTQKKGYFVEGKFDQLQRNQPYFAWLQAFQDFIHQILTQSQENLEQWRQRIQKAVGNNGRIITNIIPDLYFIIGEQPEVESLGATEEQNRFNYVLQNFVNAISKKDHPLVIFIDDWQWADSASLNLLKTLLSNQNEDYLLIIGAYRNNEVTASHPLLQIVDDLHKENVAISNIHLQNLTEENIAQIIADTLRTNLSNIQTLAELVYKKTQGNAFFVNQMLKSLYEEEFLWFDYNTRTWKWDFEKIKSLNISENVVELMAAKVQKLSLPTQQILKLASCIGGSFDLLTLAIIDEQIQGQDTESVRLRLEEAMIEGLVIPRDNIYRFSHDRVQQAVYLLIPEEERQHTHLKIGRLLKKNIPPEEHETYIFDITNQLNYGIAFITELEEKFELAKLNLEAGRKAQASAAYKPSLEYLNKALNLIDQMQIWETNYDFALALHNQFAQTCYLKKDFESMQHHIDTVIAKAIQIRDTIDVYEIKMQFLIAQGNQQEALNTGLEIVQRLNVQLIDTPPEIEDVSQLKNLPKMQDENILAVMDILDSTITPAWAIRPDIFVQICYTMIDLSMRYGNSASSAVGYAFYGGWLCGTAGEIEKGYQFGKLAMNVLNTFKAKYLRSKIENLYVSTVIHWKEPARATIQPHFDAIQIGLETGDIEFASYNIVESMHYHFLMGIDLPNLLRKYEKNHGLIEQLKQEFHLQYLIPWEQMILNFLGSNHNPTKLKGEIFDEDEQLPQFIEEEQLTLAFVTFQAKTFLAYFFGEYEAAREYAMQTDNYKGGVGGMLFLPVHNFFYSLILLECMQFATETEKVHYFLKIGQHQEQLKAWAEASPENHEHRYLLVEAEISQINNDPLKTMELYDLAIQKAHENKFLQDEALAHELAAKFFLQSGKTKIAKTYLNEAYALYNAWGAKAKAMQLEQNYLNLLSRNVNTSTTTTQIATVSTSLASPNLDLRTIIKASQTLSGEVVFNNLLKRMMQIVIESAGAEKGLLLDKKDGKLYVKARGRVGEEIEILENVIADEPTLYPLSITNYVGRTQEHLVLFHASEDKNYQSDAYVQQHKPKSILSFPIVSKGTLWGIIYLENNLIAGAFTPERLEVLKILSTQIVISMENSSLYENLEEKVRERTAEVSRQKEIIEKKNHDITSSINYAKRIQEAMLPRQEAIRSYLGEHFIFFKPRDIVSGDFYFFSAKDDSRIIISAADCTGHGVPGAFMSLIGHELLNKIVNLKSITSPEKVLEQLHVGVNKALRQDSGENKDGMDIALCTIDKGQKMLAFAGAKNPLIYIQNGVVYEIKGDKMPIGGTWKTEISRKFEKHTLYYRVPTYCYIFSDGFQDQFGGESERKFMKKNLKKLLLEHHQKPFEEQYKILDNTLHEWMLDAKQLDDILIIGFKLG